MAIKSDSYLASLFGLEGKTIVVTGAGGGIGLAISEGLLRAGAEVALCNRTTAKCKPLADRDHCRRRHRLASQAGRHQPGQHPRLCG